MLAEIIQVIDFFSLTGLVRVNNRCIGRRYICLVLGNHETFTIVFIYKGVAIVII